ncbi:MAG TPA: anthrone oxygenase family protein [Acidimicrobiales bacterium]|nr:anthrone oxygenase family protein [Acidimicrobiales bacterium]
MSDLIPSLVVLAAVGSALVAGLLLAFSTSVMPALARRPAPEGSAAMQAMNSAILNPLFGLLFGGTAVVCLALAASAPFSGDEGGAGWRAAGGLLYLLGVVGVTMVVNVPMNESLDRVDPGSADGAAEWGRYLRRWTAWNHVRTALGTAAAAALVVAA